MAKIVWKKEMSVGNRILDRQHKEIIRHFNKINDQLSASKGVELGQVRDTIHFTYEYIKDHFTYEEAFMKKAKLPGFKDHVKIHKTLIKIFDAFVDNFHYLYEKEWISPLELAKLLSNFERDVVKYYVQYMIKELDHLKRYKDKLANPKPL